VATVLEIPSLSVRTAGAREMSGKRVGEVDNAETSKRFRSAVDESLTHLVCAITQELPLDPVTAEDGNIYERSAIEEWLKQQQKSPMTNQPMGARLLPACQIRSMIETMVRSGAISGEVAESWRKRLEEEQKVARVKEKADGGDVEAMMELAHCYDLGKHGLRTDRPQSLRWLERAAKAGSLVALRLVGGAYTYGLSGITKDAHMGLVLLTEAAAGGDSGACRILGDCYKSGRYGPAKSVEHARKWYERACKCEGWSESRHKPRVEAWLLEHAHGPAVWADPSRQAQ